MTKKDFLRMSRREMLRLGGSAFMVSGAAAFGAAPAAARQIGTFCGQGRPDGNNGDGTGGEPVPLSPLILDAFQQDLPVPQALAPVTDFSGWAVTPDKYNPRSSHGGDDYHQRWSGELPGCYLTPNVYKIALQVGQHRVTNGRVQSLQFTDGLGPYTLSNELDEEGDDLDFDPTREIDVDNTGVGRKVRRVGAPVNLPYSAITGFSGTPDIPNSATFPGPMINSVYYHCNVMRFQNQLHLDNGLDLQDFGDPERGFLTHLHNAHTACESDGNPNDTHHQWCPGEWCDNMYLNYPAGGDAREMQSFLWFHDHTHNHTGANVYKGMVGLYPIYDEVKDPGDETRGLRLPGVRVNRPDGAFDVKYDIPIALYDCLLDDGVTPHHDWHNGCRGEVHPEWWGKLFFRHYPNHGFVGDVFTVNGVAYPKLVVDRRRYRLRFLGASVARCYELMIMRKRPGQTIQAVPGLQGQYSFGYVQPDGKFKRDLGEQCFRPTQIASEGGLLPFPKPRDMWQIWPANRKEFVIDFKKYLDGSTTKPGDEFYLVNIMKMKNGRKPNTDMDDPDFDPTYCVPLMKFVVSDKVVVDKSRDPLDGRFATKPMRALPPLPTNWAGVKIREFELDRGGNTTGENQWTINGEEFDPTTNMAEPMINTGEIWVLRNNSGGWVHPMHLHHEEHQVIAIRRAGSGEPLPLHHDHPSKEDVANLGPGEEHWVYRKFRTFPGKYVAHCHNLAHEDHAMMFGWEIKLPTCKTGQVPGVPPKCAPKTLPTS